MRQYQKEYESYMKSITDYFIKMNSDAITDNEGKSHSSYLIEWNSGIEYAIQFDVSIRTCGLTPTEIKEHNFEISKQYLLHNSISYDDFVHRILDTNITSTGKQLTKEAVWAEIMSTIKIWTFDKKGYIYNTDGDKIIEQDIENQTTWLSYNHIWSVFEKQFNMNFEEIQSFTYDMLLTDKKMNTFTTTDTHNMNFVGGW